MDSYVIIFRQGSSLTEDEVRSRAEETGAWAQLENSAGHNLDPHILAPGREIRGSNGLIPDLDSPITALLFLEAHDLHEAAHVAESHPALRYGASVEVRAWGRPVPAAAQ
jgi:hypothetical protein